MRKRGQAALELMIIIGVALAVLLVIFSISNKTTSLNTNEFEINKARSVVEDLANAAELVYRQGVGSKSKVYVNFPRNINRINFTGRTLLLNVDASGGREVYRSVDFTIENGTISSTSGNRAIYVIAGKDFVYVTEDVNQEAEYCGNSNQEGLEDCDASDLDGKDCFRLGYDDGNISCTGSCTFNQTECAGPGTVPDSITNLQFDSSDAYSIKWTWTNPSTPDFKENIVYINNSNVGNTSDAFFTATNLTPLSEYVINVHTTDWGGNINNTDVINVANSSSNETSGNTTSFVYVDAMPLQDCNAEDEQNKGTLSSACDGIYPQECGPTKDLLSCNDANSETHTATKVGANRKYGGLNITVYNTSATDCNSLDTVLLCYEWWASGSVQDCDISVDADGGSSYTAVTTTCPGTTSNPGITCTNVTGLESWTCNSFFNTTGTKAIAKSEAQHAATGTKTITWDALYYNVTYTVIT